MLPVRTSNWYLSLHQTPSTDIFRNSNSWKICITFLSEKFHENQRYLGKKTMLVVAVLFQYYVQYICIYLVENSVPKNGTIFSSIRPIEA